MNITNQIILYEIVENHFIINMNLNDSLNMQNGTWHIASKEINLQIHVVTIVQLLILWYFLILTIEAYHIFATLTSPRMTLCYLAVFVFYHILF